MADSRFEDKRRIVENIVERITVGDAEIGIELYYLPAARDAAKEQRNHAGAITWPT